MPTEHTTRDGGLGHSNISALGFAQELDKKLPIQKHKNNALTKKA